MSEKPDPILDSQTAAGCQSAASLGCGLIIGVAVVVLIFMLIQAWW